MSKKKKSKKEVSNRSELELDSCKHCSTKIPTKNVRTLPKKFLQEKFGFWGGIEKPYIEIYKITCPSRECGKTYSLKYRGSDWFYK